DSLEYVGDSFHLGRNKAFKSAENLREVRGCMEINDTSITQFRAAFPSLQKVGMDLNSTREQDHDVSLVVPSQAVKDEVEKLKQDGTLSYDGIVLIQSKFNR